MRLSGLCNFSVFTKCLLLLAMVSGSAIGQDYHLFHFDEQVPLKLNKTRIATFGGEEADNQLLPAANSFGISVASVEAHPISGWQLLTVDLQTTDKAALNQNLETVIEQSDSEFVAPVFVDDLGGPFIPTQDILVRFEQGTDRTSQQQIIADLDIGTVLDVDWANMPGAYRIRSKSKNGLTVLDQANALACRKEVVWAEPDMIFTGRGSFEPNDEFFEVCWGLNNTGQFIVCQNGSGLFGFDMDAAEAWDTTIGNEEIMVLILETGVQQDHPDLNQIPGADFTGNVGDGSPVNPCENHGTAVAGCVTSIINNEIGAVGVAPGCRIASGRVFVGVENDVCNNSWNAQFSWGADALTWAESLGVRVTNNSNFYGGTSAALEAKYEQTRNDGMIHFASAGNNGDSTVLYPARLESVNAVAALNYQGQLASFSTSGVGIAFSAPGEGIATTDRVGAEGYNPTDYVCVNGTSFASPYTAGVAALVLSVDPSLNAFEVEQIMQESSVDLGVSGYDTTFGWGMVNANQAVELANQSDCESGYNLGDVNNDGLVDLLDVGPFVNSILSARFQCEADINQDGAVTLLDVSLFVDLITG